MTVSQRTCIVTRKALPREELLRFVLSPGGEVVFDAHEKLPGRGCWLVNDGAALQQAIEKGAFSRAFKCKAAANAALAAQTGEALRRRVYDRIALCRKAGALVAGFEKVSAALKKGRVALLLVAGDAGEDRRKMEALAAQAQVTVMSGLERDLLGGAIGRDQSVYLAVTDTALADTLLGEIRRLAGFTKKDTL